MTPDPQSPTDAARHSNRVLIFLDVDGVLNSLRSIIAYRSAGEKALDPVAIKLLDRLCVALTDAGYRPEVVISSTWRMMRPRLSWWNDLWARHGCCATRTVGCTPDFTDMDPWRRGREVRAWLQEHGHCEAYVCLDDESDFLPGQPLVQTTFEDGLQVEHINRAYLLLTGVPMPGLPSIFTPLRRLGEIANGVVGDLEGGR